MALFRAGATWYVYDGDTVIAEIGPTGTTYNIPGVYSINPSVGHAYRHEYGLGSTIAESADDWNTTTFGSYEYDAYGEPYTLKTGYFTSRFKFAGKSGYYTDSDTGLVLCGARFYLPALGRFLTQDPIGQAGGLNLYEYCSDNPVNKLDPRGTDAYVLTWGGFPGSHSAIAVDWPGAKAPKVFDFGPVVDIEGGWSKLAVAMGILSVGGEVSPPGPLNLKKPDTWSHPGDYPDDIVSIPTTANQDKALRAWLLARSDYSPDGSGGWQRRNVRSRFGDYGFTHECADFTATALRAAGIWTGFIPDHAGSGWSPSQMRTLAYRLGGRRVFGN